MRLGKSKRQKVSGIAERLGLTGIISSIADVALAHKFPIWADVAVAVLSLTLLWVSVIILPDD